LKVKKLVLSRIDHVLKGRKMPFNLFTSFFGGQKQPPSPTNSILESGSGEGQPQSAKRTSIKPTSTIVLYVVKRALMLGSIASIYTLLDGLITYSASDKRQNEPQSPPTSTDIDSSSVVLYGIPNAATHTAIPDFQSPALMSNLDGAHALSIYDRVLQLSVQIPKSIVYLGATGMLGLVPGHRKLKQVIASGLKRAMNTGQVVPKLPLGALFSMFVPIRGAKAASHNATFLTTVGGTGTDQIYSVQQTQDGGFIGVGDTNSVGAGSSDVLLIKGDRNGTIVWRKTAGWSVSEQGYAVQQTQDGGFIVSGYKTGTGILLIKFNATGQISWTKTLVGGTSGEHAYYVQQTQDNGFIVVGDSFGGAGSNDFLLAKFDATGGLSWAKTAGGTAGEVAVCVQETQDGGFIVLGYSNSYSASYDLLLIKFSSSGSREWARTLGGTGVEVVGYGNRVQQTQNGGFVVIATTNSFGAGDNDILVATYTSTGTLSWAITLGGAGTDLGMAIRQTQEGGFIITGKVSGFGVGSYDLLLAKITSTGTLLWAKIVESGGNAVGYSIQPTDDGGFILGGSTTIGGDTNILFARLDANGRILNCNATHFINLTWNNITNSVTVSSPTPTVLSSSLTASGLVVSEVAQNLDQNITCIGGTPTPTRSLSLSRTKSYSIFARDSTSVSATFLTAISPSSSSSSSSSSSPHTSTANASDSFPLSQTASLQNSRSNSPSKNKTSSFSDSKKSGTPDRTARSPSDSFSGTGRGSASISKTRLKSGASFSLSVSPSRGTRDSYSKIIHQNVSKSNTRTSSNLQTIKDNLEQPPQNPLETFLDKGTARAVITSATATSISTAIFNPAYANTVANAIRISSLATFCANANNVGQEIAPILYVPWIPVTLGSSDSAAASVNGAIISTTILTAAVFVLFILTGYARNEVDKRNIDKAHKIFSQIFALMFSYYGPNVMEIATLSVGHFSSGDKGLAIPAIGLWNAVLIWVGFQIYQKTSEGAESRYSLRPFYKPVRDLVNKLTRMAVITDVGVANLLAILAGVKPNPSSCKIVASLMLAVAVGYLGYLAKLRPYKAKLDQGLVGINALFLTAISALNLATLFNNEWLVTLGKVEFAMFCYTYLQMAVLMVVGLKRLYERCRSHSKIEETNLNQVFNSGIDEAWLDNINILEELALLPSEHIQDPHMVVNVQPTHEEESYSNSVSTAPASQNQDRDQGELERDVHEFLKDDQPNLQGDDIFTGVFSEDEQVAGPLEAQQQHSDKTGDLAIEIEDREHVALDEEDSLIDPRDNPLRHGEKIERHTVHSLGTASATPGTLFYPDTVSKQGAHVPYAEIALL
jgi:hypothetical protein